MRVSATRTTIAGRISRNMTLCSSSQMQDRDHEIDGLDADKRNDHAADSVDQKIAQKQRTGTDRSVAHTLQRKRNERDDDQRVENDCRKDGAFRRFQLHDVERVERPMDMAGLPIEPAAHPRTPGELITHLVPNTA